MRQVQLSVGNGLEPMLFGSVSDQLLSAFSMGFPLFSHVLRVDGERESSYPTGCDAMDAMCHLAGVESHFNFHSGFVGAVRSDVVILLGTQCLLCLDSETWKARTRHIFGDRESAR